MLYNTNVNDLLKFLDDNHYEYKVYRNRSIILDDDTIHATVLGIRSDINYNRYDIYIILYDDNNIYVWLSDNKYRSLDSTLNNLYVSESILRNLYRTKDNYEIYKRVYIN